MKQNINLPTLLCLIVGGREGSNKMHQGKNNQDFVKWWVVFRSCCDYMNLRGFCPQICILTPHKNRHKTVRILPYLCCL